MAESPLEFPYRTRAGITLAICILILGGAVAAVFFGWSLFNGAQVEVFPRSGVWLRGPSGAAVLWGFAVVAVLVAAAQCVFLLTIRRLRPRIVLEADAIVVPSKYLMRPVRIPINRITHIARQKKGFGRIGLLWLTHSGRTAVLVEDVLPAGAIEQIHRFVSDRTGPSQLTN